MTDPDYYRREARRIKDETGETVAMIVWAIGRLRFLGHDVGFTTEETPKFRFVLELDGKSVTARELCDLARAKTVEKGHTVLGESR